MLGGRGPRGPACGLDVRIVRWWDPSPVFGPVSRVRLDHGCGVLARLRKAAEQPPGLAGYEGPAGGGPRRPGPAGGLLCER